MKNKKKWKPQPTDKVWWLLFEMPNISVNGDCEYQDLGDTDVRNLFKTRQQAKDARTKILAILDWNR